MKDSTVELVAPFEEIFPIEPHTLSALNAKLSENSTVTSCIIEPSDIRSIASCAAMPEIPKGSYIKNLSAYLNKRDKSRRIK